MQQDKNLSSFDELRCQNNGNLKIYDFLQKLKRWSVSCYTDRLSANQIAGKPVRISCHVIIDIIRWRSISMRAGPAFLQLDWSKAGLSMDLPVFVYSHTKTGFKFFQDREDIGSFLCAWNCAWRSLTSNHAERTSQRSCFVQTEICQGLLIIEIVLCIHYFIVSSFAAGSCS